MGRRAANSNEQQLLIETVVKATEFKAQTGGTTNPEVAAWLGRIWAQTILEDSGNNSGSQAPPPCPRRPPPPPPIKPIGKPGNDSSCCGAAAPTPATPPPPPPDEEVPATPLNPYGRKLNRCTFCGFLGEGRDPLASTRPHITQVSSKSLLLR